MRVDGGAAAGHSQGRNGRLLPSHRAGRRRPARAIPRQRRAVYERARTALIAQLRNLDPPLIRGGDPAAKRLLPRRGDQPRRGRLRGGARGRCGVMSQPPCRPITWQPEDRSPRHRLTACAPPAPQAAAAEERGGRRSPTPSPPSPGRRSTAGLIRPCRARGGRGAIIFGSVLALVIAAIAAFAFLRRDRPEDLPRRKRRSPRRRRRAPVDPRSTSGSGEGGSVGAGCGSRSRVRRLQRVQRAVFYEEDPANPQTPKAQVGRVTSGASKTSMPARASRSRRAVRGDGRDSRCGAEHEDGPAAQPRHDPAGLAYGGAHLHHPRRATWPASSATWASCSSRTRRRRAARRWPGSRCRCAKTCS